MAITRMVPQILSFASIATAIWLAGAGSALAATPDLNCDASLAGRFKPDALTRVIAVHNYKKGDALPTRSLAGIIPDPRPTVAEADLCLVKLIVGPGKPGPVDAPSSSAGIGIEIWLPAKAAWNGRIHALGNGGWTGSEESDPNRVSSYPSTFDGQTASTVASKEGAVTVTSDGGHASPSSDTEIPSTNGSFAMLPDGSINSTLMKDFASRAVHEQAVKAKALATAYYGRAANHSYFEGGSNGGRQAVMAAQSHAEDFDGIIAGFPAIGWTRFVLGDLYPQIAVQRDLGGKPMSKNQLDLVSNAAIGACDLVGGKHLGFVSDSSVCHYDPTADSAVLCASDGGRNATPACLTVAQARVINKTWYGMTSDGSVPDPKIDNGTGPLSGKHLAHGLARGTDLNWILGPDAFPIAADALAIVLQDASFGSRVLRSETTGTRGAWKSMSYADLAKAAAAGIAAQPQLGFVNSDNPDLSAFRAAGGKLILVHGTADALIPYGGSTDYYRAVTARMGTAAATQTFFRMYIIEGMAHGTFNGLADPAANPPIPHARKNQIYDVLTAWVERNVTPEGLVVTSVNPVDAKSRPLCAYPGKATYRSGDPTNARSYVCQ